MTVELANFLADQNAKTRAWIAEDPANRWAGLYPEDLAYWADMGVRTVEDLELFEMTNNYSDFYKDVYGFRPRHDTSSWTREDWKAELDKLSRQLEENIEMEKIANQKAIQEFENRVQTVIESGAGNRETALRWMLQADGSEFDHDQDIESWVYDQGLLFTDAGRKLVEDIRQLALV